MSHPNTPTTRQFVLLADDAAEAGDWALVDLIDSAKRGDLVAAAECQRVMDALNCGDEYPVPAAH